MRKGKKRETLTSVRRYHCVNGRDRHVKKCHEFIIVFRANLQTTNLGQTLQGNIPELWYLEELKSITNKK